MINSKVLVSGLMVTAIAGYGVYEFLRSLEYHPTIILVDNPVKYDDSDKEEGQTYLQYFQGKKISVVDKDVSQDQLANIMLGRMFPNYRKEHRLAQNQLFTGSQALVLNGQIRKNSDGKGMFILDKNTSTDIETFRTSCIAALNQTMPKGGEDPQLYRLREWCTVSTVRDVLKRHKLQLPQKDEEWKPILKSEWITESKYHDQQSFFSKDELKKMKDGTDDEKVATIKNRCNAALDKIFTRSNFPAPTSFLKSSGNKADEFQEAALFCTKPTTAEDYIKKAMQGKLNTEIPKELEGDFCYDSAKANDLNYLKNIKTIDPMDGKSFWCAVRMMYHKKEDKQES